MGSRFGGGRSVGCKRFVTELEGWINRMERGSVAYLIGCCTARYGVTQRVKTVISSIATSYMQFMVIHANGIYREKDGKYSMLSQLEVSLQHVYDATFD